MHNFLSIAELLLWGSCGLVFYMGYIYCAKNGSTYYGLGALLLWRGGGEYFV